jgi:hypothetical protein
VSAAALLGELRERGVEVWAAGDRLRYMPRSAVDPELRDRLAAHKAELLEALGPEPAGTMDLLEDGPVLEVRHALVAVRLHSRLLDRELWLARDDRTRDELAAENPGEPVLTFREAPHLRGKPVELLRAVLEVKAEFEDARWLQ